MPNDTIRDYWTGSSLHAEYWANVQGSKRPDYEIRWAKAHRSDRRGLYRSQHLQNTVIV